MPAPSFPKVYIVVLHWNSFAITADCLASLRKLDYPASHVLIVDNGSTDGSGEVLCAQFPEVEYLRAERNHGYAGGCNLGIRWALDHEADYVLLMNNDTVSAPDVLRLLVEEAERDPTIGIVGPKILDAAGKIWFAGARQQKWTLAAVDTGIGLLDDGQEPAEPRDVDYIFGCAMLVKRRVWETVGPLDTASFMYAEDIDFCLRARAACFRLRYVPAARVWHMVAASTKGRRPLVRHYRAYGRAWLLSKHCTKPLDRTAALAYLVATGLWGLAIDLCALDLQSATAFVRGAVAGWLNRPAPLNEPKERWEGEPGFKIAPQEYRVRRAFSKWR